MEEMLDGKIVYRDGRFVKHLRNLWIVYVVHEQAELSNQLDNFFFQQNHHRRDNTLVGLIIELLFRIYVIFQIRRRTRLIRI